MTPENFEILAYDQTPLGMLCLRRRRSLNDPGVTVTEITLNHEFLMSSYYTDSERALANIALEMHAGKNLNVLIGGLGLGYTAGEVLKSERVNHAEVVEFLPQVMAWLDKGLIPLAQFLASDRRLRVIQGDVYDLLLQQPKEKYDIILIDVDHSPDERLNSENTSFYSQEGLNAVKKHLTVDGILGIWSYSEDMLFEQALRDVFDEIRIDSISFRHKFLNNEQHTDWLYFAR